MQVSYPLEWGREHMLFVAQHPTTYTFHLCPVSISRSKDSKYKYPEQTSPALYQFTLKDK
jgi:hypothetical protein